MATSLLLSVNLILEFDAGIINGKQKITRKSFSNVRDQATDEGLLSTANALASLQDFDLARVLKRATSNIRD